MLVNDFGEIDIDSRLIVQHDGRTITLANGLQVTNVLQANGTMIAQVRLTGAPAGTQFAHLTASIPATA